MPAFELTPLVNLRDLGGTRVAGGVIRPGRLLRSDDAALMTDAEARDLVDGGLTTQIDLRSEQEAERTGRGPLGALPVDYELLPLRPERRPEDESIPGLPPPLSTPAGLGSWYAHLLRTRAEVVVAGLRIVADAPGAVLFHCAAGKDRTGVFAASVLAMLGADEATILDDYELTDAVIPAIIDRLVPIWQASRPDALRPGGALDPAVAGSSLRAERASLRIALAELDAEGGLREILRRAGADDELESALRTSLVEPDHSAG